MRLHRIAGVWSVSHASSPSRACMCSLRIQTAAPSRIIVSMPIIAPIACPVTTYVP